MKLEIKARRLRMNAKLLGRIETRVGTAFSRTRHAVESMVVTMSDINGPRGGEDKRVNVVVRSPGLPTIIVNATQRSLYTAVDAAVSKAGRKLMQAIARRHKRSKERITHHAFAPVMS